MKQFYLYIFLTGMLTTDRADAQFTKGQRLAGASIVSGFFNSGDYDYTYPSPTTGYHSSTNRIGVSGAPMLGWFISPQLVLGGRLLTGYDYSKAIDDAGNISFRKRETRELRIGAGVFARNYFSTTGKFIPFVQINLDGGTTSARQEGYDYAINYKDSYSGRSSDDFFFSAGIGAGITRMLDRHTGLDVSIGYNLLKQRQQFNTTTLRDVDFDGSIDETLLSNPETRSTIQALQFSIGLQIFLDHP